MGEVVVVGTAIATLVLAVATIYLAVTTRDLSNVAPARARRADFVSDNMRETIGQRFDAATAVSSRDERRTLDAAKNLAASLDQIRELIDRELGLKASRRPL